VNWFGHKTDVPDGTSFTDTSCGLDEIVIEEPSKPVSEEFYVNLAKTFTRDLRLRW
jgi:hypothetical protein